MVLFSSAKVKFIKYISIYLELHQAYLKLHQPYLELHQAYLELHQAITYVLSNFNPSTFTLAIIAYI